MLLLRFLCLLLFLIHLSFAGVHEKRLLKYLFDKERKLPHNPLERPVKNESEAVPLRFGVLLNEIMDVDEKNQVIKTSIMLKMNWRDYHFQWNPKNYGGITAINVNPTEVWMPDLLLYNSADDNFNAANPVKIVISHDGKMSYSPPGLFKSTCTIVVTWFPFDRQTCTLKFGTWSYNGNDVNLKLMCPDDDQMMDDGNCTQSGAVDLSDYRDGGEWTLSRESTRLQRNVERYSCCPIDYIDVKMKIVIQRRVEYYLFNFVLPCVIISGIALLDFLLPSDAGEKISLGVTIMLSLSMFQLLLADNMPQSSIATPLLSVYFSSMMVLSVLSIMFTVLVLSCHHNDHEIPKFLKVIVNQWLARILLITSPEEKKPNVKTSVKKRTSPMRNVISELKTSGSLLANILDLPTDTHSIYQGRCNKINPLSDFETCVDEQPESGTIDENGVICSLHDELKSAREQMEFITQKIKENDEESDLLKEWKFAAYVIDRFCVTVFSLLALFVTGGIFSTGAILGN